MVYFEILDSAGDSHVSFRTHITLCIYYTNKRFWIKFKTCSLNIFSNYITHEIYLLSLNCALNQLILVLLQYENKHDDSWMYFYCTQESEYANLESNIRWAEAFILMYSVTDKCSFDECHRLKFLINYNKRRRRLASSIRVSHARRLPRKVLCSLFARWDLSLGWGFEEQLEHY